MPLPEGGKTAWPPEHIAPINRQLATWAAWYGGDTEQLAAIYSGTGGTSAGREFFGSETGRGAVRRVVDSVRRWFWGSRAQNQPRQRLHVPLAADIAAASAGLLFADPPPVTVETSDDDRQDAATSNPTQDRLDDLLDDGAQATLLEAAEICAALGGVYLRVCWDSVTSPDRPWFAAVDPSAAVPEWRFGRLQAVTFWRVIAEKDRVVVRHLERHEPGKILHGVYEGSDDELGVPVPLTDYPETAALAATLTGGNEIATGHEGLTAVYVPNMRPNRVWRNTPGASAYGRSDYAGAESLMDGLDLTYSSWMRDVELGKARLIVPREYLTVHGKGEGASVDLDREVYEGVNVMGGDEGKPEIKEVQFAIRVEEHRATIHDLKLAIVSAAGYAAQTFGLDEGGQAVTATEIAAQTRRSLITRGHKLRYWGPALADLLEALLAVDIAHFGTTGVTVARPLVEWPDAVAEDPKAVAETVETWQRAQSASIETRVRRLHPDWDDPMVADEVERIKEEGSLGEVTDPAAFRGVAEDATGQQPEPEPDDDLPDDRA